MQSEPVDYSRKWLVMTAVGLATFLETIDASAVSLALPTLVKEFAVDFALVQWVMLVLQSHPMQILCTGILLSWPFLKNQPDFLHHIRHGFVIWCRMLIWDI